MIETTPDGNLEEAFQELVETLFPNGSLTPEIMKHRYDAIEKFAKACIIEGAIRQSVEDITAVHFFNSIKLLFKEALK